MDREEKNNRIREKGKATRERHADMLCRCYEVKVDSSKMSRKQKNDVNALDMDNVSLKDTSVSVKVGDVFEQRDLSVIGSQIRQTVITEVKNSLKGLSYSKKKGNKVGALKFKPVCNSVELSQYHVTYDIDKEKSRIRVQKIKKPFRVRGLDQIPENVEIANARFIRKASGLYFHITCYLPKEEMIVPDKCVGIDFGIKDNLVFSDGRDPINIYVPESKGTKLAARRMNKALSHNGHKKSKRQFKRKAKLQRAYEKDCRS